MFKRHTRIIVNNYIDYIDSDRCDEILIKTKLVYYLANMEVRKCLIRQKLYVRK